MMETALLINSRYGIRTLNNNGIYTHQSVKMEIFTVDILLVQNSAESYTEVVSHVL